MNHSGRSRMASPSSFLPRGRGSSEVAPRTMPLCLPAVGWTCYREALRRVLKRNIRGSTEMEVGEVVGWTRLRESSYGPK
jgi:hypothetical protein